MTCEECLALLGGYLDGELSPFSRAENDDHLRRCRTCQQLYESCKQTIQAYRSQPVPPLPAALHRKVMQQVRQTRPPLKPGANPNG